MKPSREITDLLEIMRRLRTPGSGCPWDLSQDFKSIASYTIEEAHEVVDAIEREDYDDLADELGDLLLQVVFHAQMASELEIFSFGDVVERISARMLRRHPHVFGKDRGRSAEEVSRSWEQIKRGERIDRARRRGKPSEGQKAFLDDAARPSPALLQAVRLQSRASAVGFDWRDARKVLLKIREETDEIEAAMAEGDQSQLEDEIGDLFFALANLARHLEIDPERSLRRCNQKFVRRFDFIERKLAASGRNLGDAELAEMDGYWNEAKQEEKLQRSETSPATSRARDPSSTV